MLCGMRASKARRPTLGRAAAFAVAVLSVLAGLASTARAAAIMVNTTADDDGSGTTCSLREAVKAANTDTPYGGCTAGSGDDYVWLSSSSATAVFRLTRD